MKMTEKTFTYGDHLVTIKTGRVARQADGAVFVSMGDTVVLVTAVANKEVGIARDFFPLTVNYQERSYAAGKVPGGFFKREGRPNEREVLLSRLLDRPIRPLFPEGFTNEVQVIATVMSLDPEISAEIPAMIGASAALAISGIPFNGPLAAARVGYQDSKFLLNPNSSQLKTSELELVVAGTEDAILMVESEAKELPENIMLDAVMFGHQEMQVAIQAIKEFAQEVGNPVWSWQPRAMDVDLEKKVTALIEPMLKEAYKSTDRKTRKVVIKAVAASALEQFGDANDTEAQINADINSIFDKVEKSIMRDKNLNEKIRIDGREANAIRPIDIDVGILPRVHGSACFTRGETQAIVITTLGTENDAQIIDIPAGETSERFMLHYNFPPYCTGEISPLSSPKRREIGHGNLAKRSLRAMIPGKESFPYVIRVVSEITESNGSSSMASVCGTTLALMDAGVPIKAPVAGIAMGLIKDGEKFMVLSDISGDEDHLGDMDFKVAGTAFGITALQMDIKVAGVSKEIMSVALERAKEGRLYILNLILEKLPKPREHLSDFAPHILTIKISADKIRDVIGKGGVTIRSIVEETGAEIDINDHGVVTIAAVNKTASQAALKRIEHITAEPEVGKIYTGKVVKIMDFGAFVNILPGRDGLVHISQIVNKHVDRVEEYLQEGQEVNVKIMEIDRQGKVRLSIKEAEAELNKEESV